VTDLTRFRANAKDIQIFVNVDQVIVQDSKMSQRSESWPRVVIRHTCARFIVLSRPTTHPPHPHLIFFRRAVVVCDAVASHITSTLYGTSNQQVQVDQYQEQHKQ